MASILKKKKKNPVLEAKTDVSVGTSRGRPSESRKIRFPSGVGSMSLAYTFELKPLFRKVPASEGKVGHDQS